MGNLRGLECKTRIEVTGTVTQLAAMMTAGTAKRMMGAASKGEAAAAKALGIKDWKLGEKAEAAAAGLQFKLGSDTKAKHSETRCVDFDVIVDLQKTSVREEVVANVQIVKSSTEALNKVMSVSTVQNYVEDVFSQRMTAFVSQLYQESVMKVSAANVTVVAPLEVVRAPAILA